MLHIKVLTPALQTSSGAAGSAMPYPWARRFHRRACSARATVALRRRGARLRDRAVFLRSPYSFDYWLCPRGAGSAWIQRPIRRNGPCRSLIRRGRL